MSLLNGFTHDLGSIKGKVTESDSKLPVVGANVIIKGTMLGTITDINGEFQFKEIHTGKFELVVSFIGFQSFTSPVEVRKDEVSYLDVYLANSRIEIDAYSVVAEYPYSAASTKHIRKIDHTLRPNKSSQDLLKLTPGLVIAQHAGGGKAEQIFLRGFDADHGTDVNISVDGIPVNMVSHGHGQGYADLHFLIPETVETIDVYKGPYFAEYGNLATAGAIQFNTRDYLDHSLIKIEGGEFNTLKATMLYQPGKGSAEQNGYLAAQYYQTDGPFESPLDLQRMNIFGKYFVNLSHNSKLTVSLGSFSSSWDASGQIPQRVVEQGRISRYGAIDDLEGGITSRSNLTLRYDQKNDDNKLISVQAFVSNYDFKLFSNFTYFLEDSVNGDMIEQLDKRFLYGVNARYQSIGMLGNTMLKSSFGTGFRADNIDLNLFHSPDRIRQEVYSDASVNERNIFMWMQEEFIFSTKFRAQLGLRADYFTFNVDDRILYTNDSVHAALPHASGYVDQAILSPKINLVYSPYTNLDLFVNTGQGFHSNDARNIIIGQKIDELVKIMQREGLSDDEIDQVLEAKNFDPGQKNAITLPKATGAEIGMRTKLFKKLNIGIAAWYLHLQKEYVYVGDGGFTELSNPTERIGADLEARMKINEWLWADLDICLSNGKILNTPQNENNIPLAPRITSTGGLSFIDLHGFNGMIRYTFIGDRPANEDNTVVASGYTVVNFGLSYTWNAFTISTTIENVLNTEWNEAQFDTESRMPWESESVSEIHFTPGNPRNIQFGVAYKF
jgi:outer membrane receptor protein involved in Fe transport